jgi:hypothetical protein
MNKSARRTEKRDDRVLVVSVPISFMRRGGRKQIVVPAGATDWQPRANRCENSLINALARAHLWRRLIETSRYTSAAELSRAEGINESYLCRVLRLTLLAPDIIEAILDGRQPRTLELKSLMKPLPSDWSTQRKLLGFT